jgi:hypothetical protein
VIFLASIAIAFHLIAIVANVLAAPSGPWPFQEREGLTMPPQFAQGLTQAFGAPYLKFLHMTSNYHFMTNRPGSPDAYIEARLKNRSSGDAKTAKFPDPSANFWVRHRQSILANALTQDVPVPPPQGEPVAAPGQQVRMVPMWEPSDGGVLVIRPTPEHLVPRDRDVFRPGDWPRLLARSYARYLCRSQNATSAEIVRHWRNAIPPFVLSQQEIPQQLMEENAANFGEFTQ